MVRSLRDLVLAELRRVFAPPRLALFRVIDDLPADLPVLDDLVDDVGAGVPFGTRLMRSPSNRAFSSSNRSTSAPSPSSSAVFCSSLRWTSSSVLEFLVFLEVFCISRVERGGLVLLQRLALLLKALVQCRFVLSFVAFASLRQGFRRFGGGDALARGGLSFRLLPSA